MKAKTLLTIAAVVMLANGALIGHIYGYRLADFSEVPNSQRPQSLVTTVEIDMTGTQYASTAKR
jgi:hypothetical protein